MYVKTPSDEDNVFVCVYCISLYVCLSVCLSQSLHVFVSQHMWCSPSRPGFMSSIPGISSICWDSKSVPFPINLGSRYVTSKSGPGVLLIFQCSGTCLTPSQGDILVSD